MNFIPITDNEIVRKFRDIVIRKYPGQTSNATFRQLHFFLKYISYLNEYGQYDQDLKKWYVLISIRKMANKFGMSTTTTAQKLDQMYGLGVLDNYVGYKINAVPGVAPNKIVICNLEDWITNYTEKGIQKMKTLQLPTALNKEQMDLLYRYAEANSKEQALQKLGLGMAAAAGTEDEDAIQALYTGVIQCVSQMDAEQWEALQTLLPIGEESIED